MVRYGQVIRLKPGCFAEYARHHAAGWPEVLQTIRDCNIRNYSIFHGDGVLYAYFEYHGTDFAGDMEKMGRCPHTQRWWHIMEPMQEPVAFRKTGEWWATLEEVFHSD